MKPPLRRRWLRSVRYCSNSCRLSYRLHRRPRPERKMSEKIKVVQGENLRDAQKLATIPIRCIPTDDCRRKPDGIRVRSPAPPKINGIEEKLRKHELHTVCEEASCPNIGECFGGGTATFMIMGDICT